MEHVTTYYKMPIYKCYHCILSYAAPVQWPRRELEKAGARHLQRFASLCITGAMRTTSIAALEIFLDLPPLDILTKSEAMLIW